MGWTLIIIASLWSTVTTMPSLAACEANFRAMAPDPDIKSAVCRNLSGDEVWLLRPSYGAGGPNFK